MRLHVDTVHTHLLTQSHTFGSLRFSLQVYEYIVYAIYFYIFGYSCISCSEAEVYCVMCIRVYILYIIRGIYISYKYSDQNTASVYIFWDSGSVRIRQNKIWRNFR